MDDEPEKPEHCIEGHIEPWAEAWVLDDGSRGYDEGTYFECTKWEPGYPRMMAERKHTYFGALTGTNPK